MLLYTKWILFLSCVVETFPKTGMAGENNVMELPLDYAVLHLRMLQEFTHAQLGIMQWGERNNIEGNTACALVGQ